MTTTISVVAQKRIDKALGKVKLKAGKYVAYHPESPGTIEAVLCKFCGARIKGWVSQERYQNRMSLLALPLYEEVTIEFDDGSAHVTPMCSKCADTLDAEKVEAAYVADMQEFAEAEGKGAGAVNWKMFQDRKITGFKRGPK